MKTLVVLLSLSVGAYAQTEDPIVTQLREIKKTLEEIRAEHKSYLAKLEEQLARGPFQRCPSHEAMSRGWVSPRGDGALVHALNRQWLIALRVEQRLGNSEADGVRVRSVAGYSLDISPR
jgi:hypothetical protein